MNNVGRYGAGFGERYNVGHTRYGAVGRGERRSAPAWLVLICRMILWMTTTEGKSLIRASVAIGSVALIALVAGAIGTGALPLFQGIIICSALAIAALFATREF